MAYNLEEQEQLESLKAFWNRYGTFLIAVLAIVALSIAGWRGWGWYQQHQTTQAAGLYEDLRHATEAHDIERVRAVAGQIFEKYGRTAYGPMAALMAAHAYQQADDGKAAKIPLQWLIERSGDTAFGLVARLHLAAILLDDGQWDEGLKALDTRSPAGFAALFEDRRGDLLAGAGRRDEARAAYERALAALAPDSTLRGIVQLKRDALGGASA